MQTSEPKLADEKKEPVVDFFREMYAASDEGQKITAIEAVSSTANTNNTPNQALLPTPMSVTPPAAQEPRRP